MLIKKNIIFIILVYIIYILYCLRFFYFSHTNIRGQDKILNIDPKLEYLNFISIEYKLDKYHNNLYDYIITIYRPICDKPKSVFRRKRMDNKNFGYITDSTDEIIRYTFIKGKKSIDDFDKKKLTNLAMNNKNKMIFAVGNNGYILIFSHLLMDGLTAYNTCALSNDNPLILNVPKYYYIPIYNEILTIYGLGRTLINGIPKLNLSYDYPCRQYDFCEIIRTKIPISYVKNMKKKVSDEIGEKINFSIVFAALQSIAIFSSTFKDKLTIGIVFAFKNKFKFNNFTALVLEIKRPQNINNNYISQIEMIKQIHYKAKNEKYKINLFYSLTNIYNLPIFINCKLDILFSGMPGPKSIVSIDNINVSSSYTNLIYHSMPIYLLYLSDINFIYCSLHLRTKDINIDKLKEFYCNEFNSLID